MPSGGKREGAGRKPTAIAKVTAEELEKLAGLNCTVADIAAWFGVSEDTIDRLPPDMRAVLERGRGKGRISIRRLQMKCAESLNPTMLIFLGKQLLGQRDQVPEPVAAPGDKVQYEWVTRKQSGEKSSTNHSPVSDDSTIQTPDSRDSLVQ